MIKVLNKVLSILFIFISLISTILYCANDINFYNKQHTNNNISNIIDINHNDLMDANNNLIMYLNNKRDNLNMTYNIEGINQEFFNSKEKSHMIDVKNIYQVFYNINIICILLFIIILIYLIYNKDYYLIFNTYINIFKLFIIIVSIIIILVLLDFNNFWVTLHKIFFTNDLWLLNPLTDRMIIMYPLNFFYSIVIKILLIFITINGSMLSLSKIYKDKYLKGRV